MPGGQGGDNRMSIQNRFTGLNGRKGGVQPGLASRSTGGVKGVIVVEKTALS